MAQREFIADRIRAITPSGIRRIFDLASKLADPIDLSLGQPDFPVPDPVRKAMCDAIDAGRTGYTPTKGLPQLRERIAAQLKVEFNWLPDVLVSCGVSGGLMLALTTMLNPGDEVLLGDPYFVSYPILVRLAGGTPRLVSLYGDFQLHPERFEAAVNERTKAVIVTSPGNPTGVVYSRQDVQAVAEFARRHDLLIISDEIYEKLTYDGPSPSPAQFAPERTLLLRGFGKSHALTGLRLGYAAGPPDVIGEMAKLQQFTFVCAPHPGQYGALAAMDTDISHLVAAYRAKRDLVCDRLGKVVEFARPGGGFYVFPRTPPSFSCTADFIEAAIARKLLMIPGDAFSAQDSHFRVSYAAPNERLERGCAIIAELAGRNAG
ncbi:MAG: aminotransferase class I/II-fold pyridoxal phosphate-dependent enzyme [Planctomycetota bacterium]